MPDRDRINRGLAFEGLVREALGGHLVPGSGNGWRQRGDVKGKLIISCKAEATKSWNRIREQVREAIDMSFGSGLLPALATLDDDEEALVIMRLSDFSQMLADAGGITVQRNRAEERRELADVPAMLRDS